MGLLSLKISYITLRQEFFFANWRVVALVMSSLVALKHLNTTQAVSCLIPQSRGCSFHAQCLDTHVHLHRVFCRLKTMDAACTKLVPCQVYYLAQVNI